MYVVTFYSFKGGVGRSMAMMNTAAALVEVGRRVLVVDFDLEAPGLDTFNLPQPRGEKLGIVDFVIEYLQTNSSPAIKGYVYKSSLETNTSGELWFMPAGSQHETYAQRLSSINWRYLYEEQEGYLLFEDLKQQWKEYLDPDYVLIDSRTGHTDVGGICTRQLPDAVVCLFFPTEQNLLGLIPVVSRIRDERERGQRIQLHFVTSNVPDIDDENSILKDRFKDFQHKLGYRRITSTIHHYPSLALLNQDIFVRDRPNSRLAAEYRSLVEEIQRANPEDRKGALAFLQAASQTRSAHFEAMNDDSIGGTDERIGNILSNHSEDLEVLHAAVILRERQGRLEEAESLLTRSLEINPNDPELIVHRATLADRLDQTDVATEYATKAAQLSGLDAFTISSIVRLLLSNASEALSNIGSWPSVQKLQPIELLSVSQSLSFDRNLLNKAEQLIRTAIRSKDNPQVYRQLLLNLIGQRRFSEALDLFDQWADIFRDDQSAVFHRAMATWGNTGEVPLSLFQTVINADDTTFPAKDSTNYLQCLSLSYWAVEDIENARIYLARALQRTSSRLRVNFSSWSYLNTRLLSFRQELHEQESLIDGASILPRVLRNDS